MIEIVRCEGSFETYVTQRFDLVCELGVWISVNDRNLILFGAPIQLVVRMLRQTSIPRIDDARVLHLDVRRRLKVNVLRHGLKE
jgi:hypothetical protein